MSGTGQKKVGNIGAGNEQHKTNGAKQQEQQRSHLTHHLGVEWQSYSPQLDSVAELRRIGLQDAVGNRIYIRIGAGQGDAGLQPRQDAVIEIVAHIGQFLPREAHGDKDISRIALFHPAKGKRETAGHDANYRVGLAVERHRAADDAAITAEVALPQRIAQDCKRVSRLVFFRRKGAPQQRLHPQQRKQIAIDAFGRDAFGLALPRKVKLPAAKGGDRFKHLVLTLELDHVRSANRNWVGTGQRNILLQHDQAVWILVRQGAQDDRVHDAEDGRVRADPERKRERRDSGKAGTAAQLAKAVADILQNVFQVVYSAHVPALLFDLL